jgi:hypothetical protein
MSIFIIIYHLAWLFACLGPFAGVAVNSVINGMLMGYSCVMTNGMPEPRNAHLARLFARLGPFACVAVNGVTNGMPGIGNILALRTNQLTNRMPEMRNRTLRCVKLFYCRGIRKVMIIIITLLGSLRVSGRLPVSP